jgi:imidazolonepropionase-like amidohydrolase
MLPREPMPPRLPALIADPTPADRRFWLTGARLIDGNGGPPREAAAVEIAHGRIEQIADAAPEGAETIDLPGCTLVPGLIDAHAHVGVSFPHPEAVHGAEPILAGTEAHFLAAELQKTLRMGITTMRDVGSFGDLVVEARQAMRYGAFAGPRLLTCGRIVSPTSPGGRFFAGMYREADGVDDVRRAVREQIRYGADFVKVMTTGARTVELEDPDPAQLTREELAAFVDEAHRLGYRTCAHCEGLPGTELAVECGIDTIEHGMYLNQRPDLLELMAANDQVLVPTLSYLHYIVDSGEWTAELTELGRHNVEEAQLTVGAAKAAGVRLAMGYDYKPLHRGTDELLRLVEAGLPAADAVVAATAGSAYAVGLLDHIGTIEPGKLADLIAVEGDPIADPHILCDRERIRLVVRLGSPV